MKSRRNGKSRKDQPAELGDLVARVDGGHAIYKEGVKEGISWAACAKPSELAVYSALRHEDVSVQVEGEMDTPEWLSISVSFTGRFEPPASYSSGLPEASLSDVSEAAQIFWLGWLDGVHEAEARVALAPLMAAVPARKTLVMDPPLPTECPVCWIERNLNVKVVIRHSASGEVD